MTEQTGEDSRAAGRLATRPWILVLAAVAITACLVVWLARVAAIADFLNLFPRAPDRDTVTVSATEGWQATGVQVEAGTQVTIRVVDGSWLARPRRVGEPGEPHADGYAGEYRRDTPLPNAPVGALLGRLGDGAPFRAGASVRFVSAEAGELWLRMNDNTLEDNRGSLRVEVTLTYPTPEPAFR